MSNVFYRINVDYIKDFDAPIIGLMGAENWATLSVLAAYMDKDGYCWPSYETIGKLLCISAQAAGKRVRKLAQFHYNDQPVIAIYKSIDKGKYANNRYKIDAPVIDIF